VARACFGRRNAESCSSPSSLSRAWDDRRRRLHAPLAWRSIPSARPRPARGQGNCRAGTGVGGRGVSASESRFEAVHAAGLTDLIGREDELDFLLERQRLAWKGEGQVVLILGEPGIGKSRLTAALAERIAGETYTRLRYQCSPYHINSALRPFIAQLERAAGFKADDTPEHRLDKFKAGLAIDRSRVGAAVTFFLS